jgi:PAS domain S-box-containing protein
VERSFRAVFGPGTPRSARQGLLARPVTVSRGLEGRVSPSDPGDLTPEPTSSIDPGSLHAALSVLAAARTLEDAVPHLLEAIGGGMVAWDLGALLVVDEQAGHLRSVRGWAGLPELRGFLDATDRIVFARGQGIPGRVWKSGEAMWVTDVTADPRYLRRRPAAATGLHTGVFLPLRSGSRILGILELYSREPRPADAPTLARLEPYAEIIGQFIERVRAEEAARERDGRYRAIIDASLDAVILMDEDGLVTDWNKQAESTFGWAAADVVGHPLSEFLVPSHMRAAHHAGLDRYLRTRRAHVLGRRLEMPALHRDGHQMTVELSIVAHELGGRVSFTGHLRDLTLQLAAQTEVRSLARFPDESPSPVLRIDRAGTITYANLAARQLTQSRRAMRTLGAAVLRSLDSGERESLEVALRRSSYSLAVQPVRDEGYASIYGLDITERVRAEEAVRRNADDIRTLYRIASNASLDLHERVRLMLGLMGDRFGMGTGVLARRVPDGIQVVEVVAYESRFSSGAVFAAAETFATEVLRRHEVLAITDAALEGWADHPAHKHHGLAAYIGAPVDVAGRLFGVLSFSSPHPRREAFRDADVDFLRLMARWVGGELERDSVTDALEDANRALAEAAERAHELARVADDASKAKSEFLAAMSHEVRTPLHGIIGSIEVLKGRPLDPGVHAFVASMQPAADHLLRIVDDILDFSRIEARELALEEDSVDVRAIVREILALYDSLSSRKSLRLEGHVAGDVPVSILSDPTRLRQLIANLVANAVKFTAEGSVELLVSMVAPDVAGRSAQLRIQVRDTGIGMDPRVLERAFEPFYQADASMARRYGGTGLGLAITRRLVELMGGTIAASSTPGAGTAITVLVPVADTAPASAVVVQSAAAAGALPTVRERTMPGTRRRPRVLVVDDDPLALTVARAMLERQGCRVETASSGSQALERLTASRYDLVMLDCRLPLIDGFEVARRHRRVEAMESRPAVPIVAATADAYAETRAACFEAGMNDHMVKPYRTADLARVLDRWLGARTDDQDAPVAVSSEQRRLVLASPGAPSMPEGALRDAFDAGGPDRVREFITMFLDTLSGIESELLPALRDGRVADAADRAHRARGAAAMVGEADLARELAHVETGDVATSPSEERLLSLIENARGRMAELDRQLCATEPGADGWA